MVTEYEARKLQRDMHHELEGHPSAVVKCAVGLLVVIAIAVAGATVGVSEEPQVADAKAKLETRLSKSTTK